MRQWTLGSWAYEWNANGSLKSVKKPSGQTINFEYDALGRRIAKRSGNKEILYIWSGNVLLHEVFKTNDNEQVITWVYEQGSFVPTAKLIDGEAYSIVSDYLGTPIRAYDEEGNLVWERELDIYGKVKTETRESANFVPFRYQGQYYDSEIDLCYNRFRYYDCNTGTYISQEPISILGGFNIYAYVNDPNYLIDPLGLRKMPKGGWNYGNMPKLDNYQLHHVIPRSQANHPAIKAAGFDVDKPSNLIYLPKESGIHPTRSIHNG